MLDLIQQFPAKIAGSSSQSTRLITSQPGGGIGFGVNGLYKLLFGRESVQKPIEFAIFPVVLHMNSLSLPEQRQV
ncbi:MAG: hypothetical protein ACKVJU_09325, partial [Verrucomicrobiales bacterium]